MFMELGLLRETARSMKAPGFFFLYVSYFYFGISTVEGKIEWHFYLT